MANKSKSRGTAGRATSAAPQGGGDLFEIGQKLVIAHVQAEVAQTDDPNLSTYMTRKERIALSKRITSLEQQYKVASDKYMAEDAARRAAVARADPVMRAERTRVVGVLERAMADLGNATSGADASKVESRIRAARKALDRINSKMGL